MRSEAAPDVHYYQTLTWVFRDQDALQVLSRAAESETRYRYVQPGQYTVVLKAYAGGSYQEVSDQVTANCRGTRSSRSHRAPVQIVDSLGTPRGASWPIWNQLSRDRPVAASISRLGASSSEEMGWTTMSKRSAAVSLAAVAFIAGGLGTAGVAAASEHEEAPLPRHGHMLLLDATFEFGPTGPEITYGKCIDLANAKKLKLNAHHEHFHFGRAGEAQRNAGHAIVPTAPVFDIPWTDCASFATFFPAND